MRTANVFAAVLLALCASGPVYATAVSADALVSQAEQQWRAGNLTDARKSFEAALTADPGSVDIQMRLAGLHLSNNDFAASIPAYQKVIGQDSGNVRAWLGLGFSYLHTGKDALAMAAFQEAIRLQPSRKVALQPLLDKLQAR